MKQVTGSLLRLLMLGVISGLAVAGTVSMGWPAALTQGQGPTMSLVAPTSCPAEDGDCEVRVEIEGVENLGAYEWWITYDPGIIELTEPPESAIADGGFLGSTGRTVFCPPPILPPSHDLQPGNVRFGCGTSGPTLPGPGGSSPPPLSTIRFVPVAGGPVSIQFLCAGLADPLGDDIPVSNVPPCVAAITPTPGPGETPPPTLPPAATATPGGATPTPGAPTATPTGPTPTPTPLPPGLEAVDLMAGCNPVASTYPDATRIQTIADRVGPAGNLASVWKFQAGTWLGYSPQFPEVSDLTEIDFLDAIFICINGPGAFVRPIV